MEVDDEEEKEEEEEEGDKARTFIHVRTHISVSALKYRKQRHFINRYTSQPWFDSRDSHLSWMSPLH